MMIHAGLCSLTLGHLAPVDVIALCSETGLTHIEWWGHANGHVPMGDVDAAKSVGDMTLEAGLTVPTYGSYYRVGESETDGLSFDVVLETAVALGASAIRVWAGTKGSAVSTPVQRQAVIDDAMRIADRCADSGLRVIFEYHQGTLTDTNASAVALAGALQHPAIDFGWQARPGVSVAENRESLQGMLPRLGSLHVFNWTVDARGHYVRWPLREAMEAWRDYFGMVAETGRDHVALLEFVKDNSVAHFTADAAVLGELVCS